MANQQAKPDHGDAVDPFQPDTEAQEAAAQGGTEREPEPEPAPEPEPQADPIAQLEAERDALRDRMMRALAEAENSRKRAERDRREGLMYGGAKLARDMLPVYDNLSRALEAAGDEARSAAPGLFEGVELTLRELVKVLEKHGVERLTPQPGDPFDPHLHQAMFEAPVPDFKAGQIIQVMAAGFRLHEQLLRPAQVGVSSTPG